MAGAPASRYPILAACIAQDRAPRADELNRVALRIAREGLGAAGDRDEAATRRRAISFARTALLGGLPR